VPPQHSTIWEPTVRSGRLQLTLYITVILVKAISTTFLRLFNDCPTQYNRELEEVNSAQDPKLVWVLPIPLSKGYHGIFLRVKQPELPANIFI